MAKDDVSTLSGRVAFARALLGLTQRDLDEAAGLSKGHSGVIEARGGDVESATLGKLATALGVSLDWLASGKGVGPKRRARGAA